MLDASTPAYFKYTSTNTQILVNPSAKRGRFTKSSDFTNNFLIDYGTFVNGTSETTFAAVGSKDASQR